MLEFNSNHIRQGGVVRAPLGEVFYNVPVTTAEMWQAVAKELAHARVDRKWRPMDVQRAGGPSYKTVQVIDAGDIGTVETLDKYATALGLALVDVLYSVLESRKTPLSPEAAFLVRRYTETTIEGRTALIALGHALPDAVTTTGGAPIPAAAAAPATPRPQPPAPRAARRRTGR